MPGHFLQALKASFADHAMRPAILHGGTTFSYADLEQRARHAAAHLQALGVGPGERVVLCTADKLAFLTGHLGTLWAGGMSLPLNPRLTRAELRFFLSDSGARVAVAGTEQRPLLESLRADLSELKAVLADAEVSEATAAGFREPSPRQEDPCLLIYSSGTTGWPKGIVHTHANVASSLQALGHCWRFAPDDVVVNVLPLFHIHGLSFATQLTLMTGGCVIFDEFQPQRTLELIGRGTVFMAVPTIYYRFLELPEFRTAARAWDRVRLFTCGSAPIRPEVLPELEAILQRHVINRYGMSETFVITSLPLQGPWPQGSVGLPLEGIEVLVARADDSACPAGEVGAVKLRGPNLFREYWRQPEATRSAFTSGWFDSGDLGVRDVAGFLTLVGRKHDLIITSGYNVYPQVVERVINDCPGVRDSAVVGVLDPIRGERIAAAVVRDDPALDEARLREYLVERLVDYQRPVSIVFLDGLPRNAMGKLLRRELKDML